MAPRIITPPREELISFEAFRAAMTNAPLDDLHKIYDSNGEHDLEDPYEGDDSDGTDSENAGPKKATSQGTGLSDDSDTDDDVETTHTSPPYEYFDARFDINRRNLTPNHSKSRHINPELQSLVDSTEIFLEQLSLKFQPLIEKQPMSTSIILANQAVEKVLMPYRKHGSQARLSESAMRFLNGGDTVRRPGKDGLDGSKDGKLRFVENNVTKQESERTEKLKRKAGEEIVRDDAGTSRRPMASLKIKILKRSDGTSIVAPATPTTPTRTPVPAPELVVPKSNEKTTVNPGDSNVSSDRIGYDVQPGSAMELDEPETQADFLSFRKTSAPFDMIAEGHSLTRTASSEKSKAKKTNLYTQDPASLIMRPRFLKGPALSITTTTTASTSIPKTLFTPLAASFSNVSLASPTAFSPTSSQATIATPSTHARPHPYSCTIDPLANAALAREAYTPVSLKFSWPASLKLGTKSKACMPTPGLLDAFNNILHFYNAEGRNLLSYYVHKYDTPAELGGPPVSLSASFESTSSSSSATSLNSNASLGSGSTGHVEPPHALFRLGISQYLSSKVGKMIESKEMDELGLTPEARRILGSVWEKHPSTHAWFDDDSIDPSISLDEVNETSRATQSNDPTAPSASSSVSSASYESSDPASDSGTEMDMSDVQSVTTDTATRHRRNLHMFHMGLNPIEKTLLARACNISVETVDAYWDDMKEKTRAWGAMKLWCEVQSRRKINQAKREGRW